MHVSPAKHSSAWQPRKCDYQTDTRTYRQTDAGQSDPYVPLCFTGDTKKHIQTKRRTQRAQLVYKITSQGHSMAPLEKGQVTRIIHAKYERSNINTSEGRPKLFL